MLQVAASGIIDRRSVLPEARRGRIGLPLVRRQPYNSRSDIFADKLNDGVDVDAASHVSDEVYKRGYTNKRKNDGDCEREMRDERTLVLRPDAAKHNQRVTKRPEKRAERQLIAAIPGEIPKQSWTHLSRRQ